MTASTNLTSDPLGRYYTSAQVGALLVNTIETTEPAIVVDLGAGDGVLVGQASEIWSAARFITVDIDRGAASSLFPSFLGASFEHHACDALESSLPERMGDVWGNADVALCNPPYIKPKWRTHFDKILKQSGLRDVLPRGATSADILFIAQNLRLLKQGGKLGLIVPDSIISGEKFAPLRRKLAEQHKIAKVIELPRNVFRGTDAKAHILVLEKGGLTNKTISIQRANEDGHISSTIDVSIETASMRLDYSFLSHPPQTSTTSLAIGNALISLTRGTYSSAQRSLCKSPVFHTTDYVFDSNFVPSEFAISAAAAEKSEAVVASTGDILIARVGRNLSKKVALVRAGNVIVSDCVFVLRVLPSHRTQIFDFLKSREGQLTLDCSARGVSAKFLTAKALTEIAF